MFEFLLLFLIFILNENADKDLVQFSSFPVYDFERTRISTFSESVQNHDCRRSFSL